MCDFSGRLVAWMDGELADPEAMGVERHVQACGECRQRIAAYEEVSREFSAYCDAVLHTATPTLTAKAKPRKLPLWVPVLASAAVAAVLLLALLPRAAKQSPVVVPAVATATPAIAEVAGKQVPQVQPVAKRRVASHRKPRTTEWAMAQPAIQIAIPAEAMFPPGAVPEGVAYIANLSLASDGSVQGVRLQP